MPFQEKVAPTAERFDRPSFMTINLVAVVAGLRPLGW